jgi:hypothetical protein
MVAIKSRPAQIVAAWNNGGKGLMKSEGAHLIEVSGKIMRLPSPCAMDALG